MMACLAKSVLQQLNFTSQLLKDFCQATLTEKQNMILQVVISRMRFAMNSVENCIDYDELGDINFPIE